MTTGRRDCIPGCQAGCLQTSHDTVIRKLIPQQQARASPTVSVPHMDPKSLFLLPALRQAGGGPFWCPLRWEDTFEQKARGHRGNLTTRTLGCLSQPCLPMGDTCGQGYHPSILPLGLTPSQSCCSQATPPVWRDTQGPPARQVALPDDTFHP